MLHQVGLIARRSVVRTMRPPGVFIPPLTFPLMLMAVNSNGLRAATHLPGFPTHSFLAFALAVPFIQGALFSTMNAGTDLARDIQTGFLTRLSLTSLRGSPAAVATNVTSDRPPARARTRSKIARPMPVCWRGGSTTMSQTVA
jgi:hypothetical protein